ncbi:MAG: alpha/beta fold hydrolase [Anaerolineales bacterium]|nr:alpha/beta fold hydrolase [Anaerolineales bacterium]
MDIDLELYRREVHISSQPLVRLSAIDISPDHPQRTLVFLHGFGGRANQWVYQLQQFSLENRVIALDLRGHGQSDKPPSKYNMAQILDDLRVALNVLGVNPQTTGASDKIVLLGHSFGGSVAAEFAAKWPERVDRLILIATAATYKLNPFYRFLLHLPLWFLKFVEPFTRAWLSAPAHVMKPWYWNTLTKWKGWEVFHSLSVPTLVIRGHRDLVFERPMFEEVTRTIPGAEESDISTSGHMVMLERREAVNRAIERFLAGETQKSWREDAQTPSGQGREALRHERPWLAHYEAGVPYTIGIPRVPVHHLLRSAVRRFPRNTAIVFEGSRMTYRHLNREVNRFANALLGLGLDKGARVVLLLPNVPQMVVGFYGTLKTGAVAVFIPPMTDPEELVRQVRESEASLLVTLTAWAGLAQQVQTKTNLPHIVLTDGADYLSLPKRMISRWRNRDLTIPGAIRYRRWLAGQDRHSPALAVSPDDLAVIQYTGGTTAEAKGVMLTHRNLVANTLQTRQWMPNAHEGNERALSVLPFSHIYGLTTALNVPVAFGATMVLKPQFKVLDILKAVKRYRPTIFPGVPNMYVAINSFRGVRKYGIGSIKACISGSAPLPVEVQEAFEKLTRGRLVEGYGLTEASPVTHANPLDGMRKMGSIGIPLPSTEACVVDLVRGRKEVPAGQIGELAVRGPQVMLGYWKNPAATARCLTGDGWLLTGDVAQMDADGYFRIIARKAEMWYPTKPGKPAFPRDVEEVLYEVPQVKEAAVVAIAGQPIAFVIAQRERPTAESLIAYCQRRLPKELVPRLVIFSDDFPRTFIGKVLRRELAKRYEQSHTG